MTEQLMTEGLATEKTHGREDSWLRRPVAEETVAEQGQSARMRRRTARWRGGSGFDKVDLYTRGTLYALVWCAVLIDVLISVTRPVRAAAPASLIAAAILLTIAQGVCGTKLISRGLTFYLGRGAVDRRLVAVGGALLVADLGVLLALARCTGLHEFPEPGYVLSAAVVPFSCGFVLIFPGWASVLQQAAVTAGVGVAVRLLGGSGPLTVGAVLATAFGGAFMSGSTRTSAWSLGVMWKLNEARELEARLAVAEERLRFGRDLHDVLGRNLAVIALKSELAVELAQRGKPAAVDQMVEVMRIARTSQQEVRDVVRGYRKADLNTELVGAQSVLRAAGIACEVTGDGGGELPAPVQSALGWVVREAATNVLRHGDPRRCVIRVRATSEAAVLDVENDGAPVPGSETAAGASGAAAGAGGSGLAGLRERLRALDGSLDAGPAENGMFRLTAEIPLAPSPAPSASAAPSVPSASSTPSETAPDLGAGAGRDSHAEAAPDTGAGPALLEERR